MLEQGFDSIAVIGDTSGYGKILSDLNQKANGTVKIVLGAKDAASIDSAVSAFESGSYGKLELVGILIESDLSGARRPHLRRFTENPSKPSGSAAITLPASQAGKITASTRQSARQAAPT